MQNHKNKSFEYLYFATSVDDFTKAYRMLIESVKCNKIEPFPTNFSLVNLICEPIDDWTFIEIPNTQHPFLNNQHLDFVAIPPLPYGTYTSSVSKQLILGIENYLFLAMVTITDDYTFSLESGLVRRAERLKIEIKKELQKIITYYQRTNEMSRWDIEQACNDMSLFSEYEEFLPPFEISSFKVSEKKDEVLDLDYTRVEMINSSNVILRTETKMIHFSFEEGIKKNYSVSHLQFNSIKKEVIEFYNKDGFLEYQWLTQNWSDRFDAARPRILIQSDEEIDTIVHLNKKVIIKPYGIYNGVKVKTKDISGEFALYMDKETCGGIYDLNSGYIVVDTYEIKWDQTINVEIPYKNKEETLLISKAAACWVGTNNYQLIAYGRVFKDNKCMAILNSNIMLSSYSVDGKQLFLADQKTFYLLETENYTVLNSVVIANLL